MRLTDAHPDPGAALALYQAVEWSAYTNDHETEPLRRLPLGTGLHFARPPHARNAGTLQPS